MDKDTYMNLLYLMTKPTLDEDDKSSYFSSKHMMTNQELCGQVMMFAEDIYMQCHPIEPARIMVFPLVKNGARVIVKMANKKGYTISVYSVARKNNIIKKLLDVFFEGAKDISDTLNEYNGKIGYPDAISNLSVVSTL